MKPFLSDLKKQRQHKMKADLFFICGGNEMKKQKCNVLPAFYSYPVASYISKAATSVPFIE